MAYDEEKPVARLLYEQDRKNAKQIQTELAVPLQTVYRWIKEGKWQQSKSDRTLNKFDQLKNMRDLVDKMFQDLASSNSPDKTRLDLLRGYQKALAEFEKSVDTRGTILQGIEIFVRFLRDKYPDAVKSLAAPLSDFPKWVNHNFPIK